MTVDTSELLKLTKRYDDWSLWNKVEALGNDQPDGYVARLLWTAKLAGDITMIDANYMLYIMPGAPELWDADDLIALIQELQVHFPDGKCERGWSSWCQALPGSADGLRDMIQEKQGDKDFAATMRQRWTELPMYWRIGVGFYLVAFGHMPHTEYPDELKQQVAQCYVTSSYCEYEDETFTKAFPAEEWKSLLRNTLLSEQAFCLYSPQVLSQFLPILEPQEMLQVALRCQNTHGTREAIEALDALGDDGHQRLQQLLTTIEIIPEDPSSDEQPWAYPILMFSYLRHCQQAKVLPAPEMDAVIASILEQYKFNWSGGSFAEYQAMMVDLLATIPQARLEPILLGLTEYPWLWVSSCPTPKVLQSIVDRIVAFPKSLDYQQEDLVKNLEGAEYSDYEGGLLARVHEPLAPYIVTTLKTVKKAPPQRKTLLKLLSQSKDPAAVEGLLIALDDSSKVVQGFAKGGLIRQGVGVCLPHLQASLQAKAKARRVATAELLGLWSSDQRLYDLAQQCLATEKTPDVRALLEKIKAPQDKATHSTTGHEEIVAALKESEGATWEAHISLGPALVEVYWRAWNQALDGEETNTYSDFYEPWIALLTHFQEEAIALAYAVRIIPCFRYYYIDDYLNVLDPIFAQLPKQLSTLADSGKLAYPSEFGAGCNKDYTGSNLSAWMAEKGLKRYGSAVLISLQEKNKKARKPAIQALEAAGAEALPLLQEAIAHDHPNVRESAVELLLALRSKEAMALLQEAEAKETQKAIKHQMTLAIATLRSETMDFSSFPRTAEGEGALDDAMAALPVPHALSDIHEYPDLQWAHGAVLSPAAKTWYISTLRQETKELHTEALTAIRPYLDDASCGALADKMIEGLDDRYHGRFYGNSLFVQGILGKPQHIEDIIKKLDDLASSRSTFWGEEGVEALVRNGSDVAIRGLEHAHKKSRRNALRSRAGWGLHRLAKLRDMSLEDLLDSAVSDFGFDANGHQLLDYGPRQISVQLGPNNEILLTDEKGKALKTPPKARATDDEAKVDAARQHITSIKKQIKQIHKSQLRRMEDALSSGRCWPTRAWEKRFLQHPLMHALSRSLLWEALPAKADTNDKGSAFLLTEEGELLDLALNALTLPANGQIRLQHPLQLTPEQLNAWQEIFADQGLVQPFSQLDRRTYSKEEIPEDKEFFMSLPMSTPGQFMGRLNQMGYERGDREDAGLICSSYRDRGPYSISLGHVGYFPEAPDTDNDMEIHTIHIAYNEESLPWRELPPVHFSELVRDLHHLMGG